MANRRPSRQPTSHRSPVGQAAPPPWTDASRGPRLHKVLAAAGVGSRRGCELLIAQGRIRVNGQVVNTSPAWVEPGTDRIELDGKNVRTQDQHNARSEKIYLVLNKPRRVICTNSDPQKRRSVLDLIKLPAHLPQRVFPVGRLDADSTGLILLTNDGELANRLTHPRYGIEKQYRVTVRGRVTEDDLQHLKQGLYLAHRKQPPPPKPIHNRPQPMGTANTILAKKASMARVKIVGYRQDRLRQPRTELAVTLREGQNREIRRLLAQRGYKVLRLQRIAIGPIKLKDLPSGQWRLLTTTQIRKLKQIATTKTAPTPNQKPATHNA